MAGTASAASQASGSASERTISSLQSQLQQANAGKDTLQSQLNELQEENTDLQEENAELKAENERLKQELEELKNQDEGDAGPVPGSVKSEQSKDGEDYVIVNVPQELQGHYIETTFVFDGEITGSYSGQGRTTNNGSTVVLESWLTPDEVFVHAYGSNQTKPLKVVSVTFELVN